jgi:hypothetical protein
LSKTTHPSRWGRERRQTPARGARASRPERGIALASLLAAQITGCTAIFGIDGDYVEGKTGSSTGGSSAGGSPAGGSPTGGSSAGGSPTGGSPTGGSPAGGSSSGGSSACGGGTKLCSGQCVDLASDPNHCNDCDTRCGSDGTCACMSGACSGGKVLFSEDFSDKTKGWTLGDLWQIGPAKASAGHEAGEPDPATDHSFTADNGVAGTVIGGNVEEPVTTYLESPPIDLSSVSTGVKLTFWRWLNSPKKMKVGVDCQAGGGAWQSLWNSDNGVSDAEWKRVDYPLDGCMDAATRFRFYVDTGVIGNIMSGWNIDDVTLSTDECY